VHGVRTDPQHALVLLEHHAAMRESG